MALSGSIEVTQDRVLTPGERLSNDKVNEATTMTLRVKAKSITERELATAFATKYFDTVADLRANAESITDGTTVVVTGYYTAGANDFGPPLTVDTSDATTADDGGSCFLDTNNLRMKRVLVGEFDVKWFGATGDGVTSDATALDNAVAYLNANQGTLLMSEGSYRYNTIIGTGTTQGALNITASNVEVVFEAGAELLMDNNSSGAAGSDGISIQEGLQNIRLLYPRIRWATQPTSRNERAGIAGYGYPSETDVGGYKCIQKVQIESPYVENCGGPGLIFHGCQDLTISGTATVLASQADGVHFNYCRRVHVDNVRGLNTGDDTVAFVNYYDATNVWDGGTPGNYPLNASAFTAWNGNGSRVGSVYAEGGAANGVRLAAATDVTIGGIYADGKGTGFKVDSAIYNGTTVLWTYYASRRCRVEDVYAVDCDTGMLVDTLNCNESDGANYFNMDLQVDNLHAKDCTNDGLFIRDCLGIKLGKVKLEGCDGRLVEKLRDITVDRYESDQKLQAYGLESGSIDPATYDTDHNLRFGTIYIHDTAAALDRYIEFRDYQGIKIGTAETYNTDGGGVRFWNCRNVDVDNVIIRNHNNADSADANRKTGLMISRCHDLRIKETVIDCENLTNVDSMEVGGGDATAISQDIYLDRIRFITEKATGGAETDIQTGSYAPANLNYYLVYQHGSNAPGFEIAGRKWPHISTEGTATMGAGGPDTLDVDDLVVGEYGGCLVHAAMHGDQHALSYVFAVALTNTNGITAATLVSDVHSGNGSIAIAGGTTDSSKYVKITFTRNGAASTAAQKCKYRITPLHEITPIT